MREILFRGKTPSDDEYTDCGEWVEGYYTRFNEKEYRIYSGYAETDCGDYYPDWQNVKPETVGQYTGRVDKNDKRIFEGDIVTGLFMFGLSVNAVVTFQDGAFGLEWYRGNVKTFNAFTSICNVEYEVIGNIHDNPELLEVTQ